MEIKLQKIIEKENLFFWLIEISGWIIFAFIFSFVFYWRPLQQLEDFVRILITFFCGLSISLLLRYVYNKFKYNSHSLLFIFFVVIFYSLSGAIFWIVIETICNIPIFGFERIFDYMLHQHKFVWIRSIFYYAIVLFIWSGIYFIIKFWLEWRQHLNKTDMAKEHTQHVNMQMFRYQLNPHFLFNTLNTIRALIVEDKIKAKYLIGDFSEYLRYAVKSKDSPYVPLKEEITAIKHYYAIQKIRYEEKIKVDYEMTISSEDILIPSYLLHPLAENSIKSGMQTSSLPLNIHISSQLENNNLTIIFKHTGRAGGHDQNFLNSKKYSNPELKNVQDRLQCEYPDTHSFQLYNSNGWSIVEICIGEFLFTNKQITACY